MRPHTKDWARPLCRTLPTGIITTGLAHDVALTPILNRAFGWLFSLAEPNLAADIELLVRYGGDLWERASAEMDSVLSSLGVAASARSGADVTGELSVPEPTNDAPWFEDFDRASGQLPGLRQALGDEDDDFSAWWALFRPGDGVTNARSG